MTLSATDATLRELQQMMVKFAPVDLRADTGSLSPGGRQALIGLIQASRMNDVPVDIRVNYVTADALAPPIDGVAR